LSHDSDESYNEIINSLSADSDPFDITARNDQERKVCKALEKLPDTKRVAFILKFYHYLTYEEIANITNCSVGTIKSRIHYAIEKLQILVGE
ncbi:RNA polymerase sigma factor, partial [candidate division KSB1 bacterium]